VRCHDKETVMSANEVVVEYAKRRLREAMSERAGKDVRFTWAGVGRLLGVADTTIRKRVVNGFTIGDLDVLCGHIRAGTKMVKRGPGGRPMREPEPVPRPMRVPALRSGEYRPEPRSAGRPPEPEPVLDSPGWLPDGDEARDASYRARVCWLTLVRDLPRRCIGPHCAALTEADNGASGFCGALPEHSEGMSPPYMARGRIGEDG